MMMLGRDQTAAAARRLVRRVKVVQGVAVDQSRRLVVVMATIVFAISRVHVVRMMGVVSGALRVFMMSVIPMTMVM